MGAEKHIIVAGAVALLVAAIDCGGKTTIEGGGGAGGSPSTGTQQPNTTGPGPGAGGYAGCHDDDPCLLATRGCCGPCGMTELGDVAAVNASQLNAFKEAECPVPEPCPDCVVCPNGHLTAYCSGESCTAVDIRDLGFTDCTQASDCRLRAGSDCCETCAGLDPFCSELIAISNSGAAQLGDLVCPEFGGACPPCVPTYPEEAFADCVAGRCEVFILE